MGDPSMSEARQAHEKADPDEPGDDINAVDYVVGLGASAGGLEALEEFFEHVDPNSGLAFVVVQHLSPDFRSLMDEILARRTSMPVRRVENGVRVEPNCVYLIPPRKELIISGGQLLLSDKDPEESFALPIDTFFRSLASDRGDRAVAVVLSGTGSDGSRGVIDVQKAGGLVLAQEPDTAKFDGMPRSACDTGAVDGTGSAPDLPRLIAQYLDCARGIGVSVPAEQTEADSIGRIVALLRDSYGIDFAHYKPSTIRRRIERRLMLNRSESIEEYVERLSTDESELARLYHDLLIGVTKFFRDRATFDRLRTEAIPYIVSRSGSSDEIRVWVAGCATGEEAYSIAMLLREALEDAQCLANVKIFATDVDRRSLQFAADGIYPEERLSELEAERVERHFQRTERGFEVVPELRKMIVFAPHNAIKDAPFTKLDLVSCRNLLIYFQPQVQKKVLSLFHFGLKTGGVLMLGPSETPGEIASEFSPIDRQHKLFKKRRDVRLPTSLRLPAAGSVPLRGPVTHPPRQHSPDTRLLKAHEALTGRFAPPSILVGANAEVLHTFAGGGAYLSHPDGKSTLNVLDMVGSELRLILHAALQRAKKASASAEYAGVRIEGRDGLERVRVVVAPVEDREGAGFLISLLKEEPAETGPQAREVDMDEISRERISELEQELQYTRENLQATLEEMETANEEIQATNEELVASNEELQSTNEELHSVNEELYTVNAEHQKKINELTELTEDMDNLFAATDVATVFMDRELRIRKFTPQVAQLFHLMPQDIGRRIDSFAHTLDIPELIDDLSHVLDTEQAIERQVASRSGSWYLLRIIPYRVRNTVDGLVLSLVDISTLKRTERKLRLMSKVFHDAADPIILEDLSGKIIDLNSDAERAYGYSRNDLLGQSVHELVPETSRQYDRDLRRRCLDQEHVRNVESVRVDRAGREHPVLLTLSLLMDENGNPAAIATIAKDISDQKRAEEEVRVAVRRRDEFLAVLSHELRNPLAAVRTAANLLLEDSGASESGRKSAQIVERQVGHMSRLLDDLLDVTRVMRGKIELRKELIDAREVARVACESTRGRMESREQHFRIRIDDEPTWLDGDPARIRQIVENLLVNASKYTERGGRIDFELTEDEEEAMIRVRDNGQGIPVDRLETIFELFAQARDGLDRSDGGMGVGLTLCRDLVSLHGGRIHADSKGPGQGSVFEVRLPLVSPRARQQTRPRAVEERELAQVSVEPAGLQVVIVEDNEDARETLRSLLERCGCTVRVASDGASGVREILRQPPQVALVDIGLPTVDGFEVARRIRERLDGDGVRLIALTGYGGPEDRKATREAGFDEHLVKPVSREMLFQHLMGTRNGDLVPN
jgi:two-component system, chemotaxis family, CheB/CheR fusion protein